MHWERNYCNVASDAEPIAEVYERVHREVTANDTADEAADWCVPSGSRRCGEGFVIDLTDHPRWEHRRHGPIVYRGRLPTHLVLDGVLHRVDVSRLTASEGQPGGLGDAVVPLLNQFRNLVAGNHLRLGRHIHKTVQLAKVTLSALDAWLEVALTVQDTKSVFSKPMPLAQVRGVYHQVQAALAEIQSFFGTPLKGKWLSRLASMRHRRAVSKRSALTRVSGMVQDCNSCRRRHDESQGELAAEDYAREHLHCLSAEIAQLLGCSPDLVPVADLSDVLMLSPARGIGIRVMRTAAAEVEPWQLIVTYCSGGPKIRSNAVFLLHEYGIVKASTDSKVTDVVLDEGTSHMLARVVNSYTFTRVPDLPIATQGRAMTVIAWVSATESLFRFCAAGKKADKAGAVELAAVCVELTERVRRMAERWDFAKEVVAGIVAATDFEHFLTETDGTLSVCMVLAALLRKDATPLFTEPKHNRLSFALIAEAVMRSCRVQLRSGKSSRDHTFYIRQALGIKPNAVVDPAKVEIDFAASTMFTGKLLRNRKLCNCTAFAVVGVLELAEMWAGGKPRTPGDVAERFLEPSVSMKAFLKKHLGQDASGKEVQLALYCQGMKFRKGSTRQHTSFTEPAVDVIRGHWAEQARMIEDRKQSMALAKEKAATSRKKLLARAVKFSEVHCAPVLFSEAEVFALNNARPECDQLELCASGLLRHHCCFPGCPLFLTNLSTGTDRDEGRRNGISKHLAGFKILGTYMPNLHTVAMAKARDASLPVFIDRMDRWSQLAHVAARRITTLWGHQSRDKLGIVWIQAQAIHTSKTVADIAKTPDVADVMSGTDVEVFVETRSDRLKQHTAAYTLARAMVNGDDMTEFKQHMHTIESRESEVYRHAVQLLLQTESKAVPQRHAKLWMCATGRALPGRQGAGDVVWPVGSAAIPSNIRTLVLACTIGHQRARLMQNLYERRVQAPRHVYRDSGGQAGRGFSNEHPSWWALGYATFEEFAELAPPGELEAYVTRRDACHRFALKERKSKKKKGLVAQVW